jgi:tetrahydromethanopterin S-methyltransferase subunit G
METLEQQMSPQSPSRLHSVRKRHEKIISELEATSTEVKKVQQTVDRLGNWSYFCSTVAIITIIDLFARSSSLLKQWFPVLNSDYFPFLVSGGLILIIFLLNWRALDDEKKLENLKSEQSELIGKKKLLEELFPPLKD